MKRTRDVIEKAPFLPTFDGRVRSLPTFVWCAPRAAEPDPKNPPKTRVPGAFSGSGSAALALDAD